MDKFFIRKSIAKLSIFAVLFNVLSTWLYQTNQVSAEYTPENWHYTNNQDNTMTGKSMLSTQTGTFDYLNTWNNQDKLNTVTGSKLDFSFELSDIYSWALIRYDYFTSTGSGPVATGSYIYTGWFNQFSNNIDIIANWLTWTWLDLTLTWLVNWVYRIWIIPGNWGTIEEYMTWDISGKVIDYEFVVWDFWPGVSKVTNLFYDKIKNYQTFYNDDICGLFWWDWYNPEQCYPFSSKNRYLLVYISWSISWNSISNININDLRNYKYKSYLEIIF